MFDCGIRRENRSGPMATGKQLKAAILARRAAKGPRKKPTRPNPRQYTITALHRAPAPGPAASASGASIRDVERPQWPPPWLQCPIEVWFASVTIARARAAARTE